MGLSALQTGLQILVGTTDPAWADANFAPISDRFVSGLLAAGTQVVLAFGSHDEYIPFGTQAEYLFKLRAWGVPVEAHVVMRGGHVGVPGLLHDRLRKAIRSYIEPGAPISWRMAETGLGSIRYYAVNRGTHQADLFGYSNIQFPFTLEVPYRVWAGMPIVAMVTGEPGTTVTITGYNGSTPVALPFECNIGPTRLCTITAGFDFLGGVTLTYEVTIQKPGLPPQTMNMTNVPGHSLVPLTTIVEPGPPPTSWRPSQLYPWLANPYEFGIWQQNNWGISEY